MTLLVTKTPAEWSGTIMELVLGFCSRSIVVGRFWYVFRRGRGLCRLPAHLARGGAMPGAPVDPAGLDQLVGARWSFLGQNCAVTFNPYWRKAGVMRSNADDRKAIVRAIVVAALFGAFALFGAGAAFDRAFMQPLRHDLAELRAEVASARQSANTHFGQVKQMLKGKTDENK